jgi:hypothetical protein
MHIYHMFEFTKINYGYLISKLCKIHEIVNAFTDFCECIQKQTIEQGLICM